MTKKKKPVMATIQIRYAITKEAQLAIAIGDERATNGQRDGLAPMPVPLEQKISVDIPLAEAIDRDVVYIHEDGSLRTRTLPSLVRFNGRVQDDGKIVLADSTFGRGDHWIYQDHLLSPEEALALWRAIPAQRAAEVARFEPEAAKVKAKIMTDLVAKSSADQESIRKQIDVAKRFVGGESFHYYFGSKGDWFLSLARDGGWCACERDVLLADHELAVDVIGAIGRRKDAAKKIADEDREDWVRTHGSKHLKLALEMGKLESCHSIYLDERKAVELPGWEWVPAHVSVGDCLNPTEEQLLFLQDVQQRGLVFAADLVYLTVYGDGRDNGVVKKGRAVKGEYLGKTVIRWV